LGRDRKSAPAGGRVCLAQTSWLNRRGVAGPGIASLPRHAPLGSDDKHVETDSGQHSGRLPATCAGRPKHALSTNLPGRAIKGAHRAGCPDPRLVKQVQADHFLEVCSHQQTGPEMPDNACSEPGLGSGFGCSPLSAHA
jgi:hypothetical protein